MRPPRSPSRDRSDRFTGFRGYVRVPDRFLTAKRMALLSAAVLVVLWLVVEFFHPRAAAFHTHGPLANPHAAWDQTCEACHVSHGVGDFSLSNVLNARGRWHDLTCKKCHEGPAHHATAADPSFHDRCSNCHHDHAGRNASLVDLSDDHCVRCHQNLPAAHRDGRSDYEGVVASFASAHPEFRALRDHPPGQNYTPRKLKFSHAVHMTPGMVTTTRLGDADVPSGALTAERLKAGYSADAVARYAALDTGKGVELSCASCHQLDAQQPGDLTRGPPRAEGAYYLPVNYDASCKACHPIAAPLGKVGDLTVTGFELPHREEGKKLTDLLRGGYAFGLVKAKHPGAEAALPGGRLDPAPSTEPLKKFGAAVASLTDTGLPQVAAACSKCHTPGGEGKLVAPLPQHTVWFPHAKFNHVSHRGLTCAECHPGTGRPAAPPGTINEVEPIAIRGVESCRACHAPAGHEVKLPDDTLARAAGVRHRCTDCHRYHNGDRPLHGLGSPLRDPRAPQSLADFLKGGK